MEKNGQAGERGRVRARRRGLGGRGPGPPCEPVIGAWAPGGPGSRRPAAAALAARSCQRATGWRDSEHLRLGPPSLLRFTSLTTTDTRPLHLPPRGWRGEYWVLRVVPSP
ncbi:unnamed protein product [Rangifer tarandus platyrhynchus]|uniref:Uncharacterized protein n=2 Tax=Rangifer tarandus platyrhynchus TaxID=3082113 RepID=A0AC59YBT0_RANTA|nr:unnamed protein product [Rangifer tarandus platyrhynchus]